MKKYVFLLIIGVFSLLSVGVYAQTDSTATVGQDSVGVETSTELTSNSTDENPGILPSNPFYFFKEWQRGITKFFTADPVKKTQLEADELDQRAAEIKKMEDTNAQNTAALSRAIENYQANADRLRVKIENLATSTQNPNLDQLLNNLLDNSIQHQQLFDNLEQKLSDSTSTDAQTIGEKLNASQGKIGELIGQIPQKFTDPAAFQAALQQKVQNGAGGVLNDLKIVGVLDNLKENLPADYQNAVQAVKDGVVNQVKNQLNNLTNEQASQVLSPDVLKNISGNQITRSAVLEEISGQLQGTSLGQAISEAQQKILDSAVSNKEITQDTVNSAIDEVKSLIDKAESGLGGLGDAGRQSIQTLIDNAQSRLQSAVGETDLKKAFQDAVNAGVLIRNAVRQVSQGANRSVASSTTQMPEQQKEKEQEGLRARLQAKEGNMDSSSTDLIKKPEVDKENDLRPLNPLQSIKNYLDNNKAQSGQGISQITPTGNSAVSPVLVPQPKMEE